MVSHDACQSDTESVLWQVSQVRRDVEANAAVVRDDGRRVVGLNGVQVCQRVGLKSNHSCIRNGFID